MRNHLLLCVLAIVFLCSCGRRTITGKGERVTVSPSIAGIFSTVKIEAPLSVKLHVVKGAANSVQLTGYKNLVEHIRAKLEGNTLIIESKHSLRFDTDHDIEADITTGSLNELHIQGMSDVKVDGDVSGGDFKLTIGGAGDVEIEQLHVDKLEAVISGAGNVDIAKGIVDHAAFKVSGAGNISGYGVQAEHVKAKVSGAGDIEVFARQTLDAKVTGAGTISYKGTPSVQSKTSGIGSVVAAN